MMQKHHYIDKITPYDAEASSKIPKLITTGYTYSCSIFANKADEGLRGSMNTRSGESNYYLITLKLPPQIAKRLSL